MNMMIMPTPERVSKRIKFRLDELQLTITGGAKACGLSQPSFEGYVYGANMPGGLALAALAHGLKCSVDWLLLGETRA
jgi:hypothetical protein